jgi:hypothetical protein
MIKELQMNLDRYIHTLPEEVLTHGTFCVTLEGDKKPYDPFQKKVIGVKDTFYDIFQLVELGVNEYDTLGIKVIDPISTIDIDHCVHGDKIDDVALDIIHSIQSYTEISPSGTGIRILFKAKNQFDRNRYKIKNSHRGIEYYDGLDQMQKGGRMVRLSANKIFDYDFKEVDTTDILNKYMTKDITQTIELQDDDINEYKCYVIGEYLKKDYTIYDIYYRHMAILSESEWDLILMNHIAFYTQNIKEIRYIFENTSYFKKKDKRHMFKWESTQYSHNLLKIVRPTIGNEEVFALINMFHTYQPQESFHVHSDLLIYIANKIQFIKTKYITQQDNILSKHYHEQDYVNHMMLIAKHRKHIISFIQNITRTEHISEQTH